MNELKVNFENLTAKERAELLKLVEKANKPKSKVWKPKKDERYYYILSHGVGWCLCLNGNGDNNRYAIGNCFKTKEEAENAAERLKIRAELQRFADEHNDKSIDWKNRNTAKWYIRFNYDDEIVECSPVRTVRDTFQIYFSSEEVARAAVQSVGEDRIKKYLFGVEV